MICLQQRRFKKRFPGPFSYQHGADGFDETFDTVCVTSGDYLVSTYFWDAVELSANISAVVTAALNHQADWRGFTPPSIEDHWDKYRRRYPGPYATRIGCCPGRGDYLDVYCTTSRESVIHSYGLDSDSKLIANQIEAALNALCAMMVTGSE